MSKFVCEPVKYKQRYRWRVVYGEQASWAEGNETYGVYWDKMWVCEKASDLDFVLISVPEKGYYLCPSDSDTDPRMNLGPYPDLPTVKSVAELYIEFNKEPVWKYTRRKKQ